MTERYIAYVRSGEPVIRANTLADVKQYTSLRGGRVFDTVLRMYVEVEW